jgi:anti-sigma regulatory factor (Ser/Thr protein kinase)
MQTKQQAKRFEPTPESVRAAREFVYGRLCARADPEMSNDLALAVSEMATNAIRHAGTPFDVIVKSDGQIRIEVGDSSPDAPTVREVDAASVGGRGLHILGNVCDRWGIEISNGGKCVWCEHDLSEPLQ